MRAAVLILLILGLAACVPAPEVPVEESPQGVASSTATATIVPGGEVAQPAESESGSEDDQFLVVPTLAPTATPGVIYAVVEQVVEATNLENSHFMGLSAADWINLGISLLLVFLAFILLARLLFSVLKKIARRTSTPYDEIYLELRSGHTCAGWWA